MELDPATLTAKERYKLTTGLVVPRPIAWVSTVSPEGRPNLAPMSYFNAVQSSPFIVLAVAVGTRGPELKDTARNAIETGEFVVNLVGERNAAAMVETSGDYPPDVSEFEVVGAEAARSRLVRPPRVAASPASFECRLFAAHHLTRSRAYEPIPHDVLLLGEVVRVHVADGILDAAYHADVAKLAPVARLGGPYYWRRGEVFALERPQVDRAVPPE